MLVTRILSWNEVIQVVIFIDFLFRQCNRIANKIFEYDFCGVHAEFSLGSVIFFIGVKIVLATGDLV